MPLLQGQRNFVGKPVLPGSCPARDWPGLQAKCASQSTWDSMPGRTGVKELAPFDVPAPMIVNRPRSVVKPFDWQPLGISGRNSNNYKTTEGWLRHACETLTGAVYHPA
jgi:hypothetical protein